MHNGWLVSDWLTLPVTQVAASLKKLYNLGVHLSRLPQVNKATINSFQTTIPSSVLSPPSPSLPQSNPAPAEGHYGLTSRQSTSVSYSARLYHNSAWHTLQCMTIHAIIHGGLVSSQLMQVIYLTWSHTRCSRVFSELWGSQHTSWVHREILQPNTCGIGQRWVDVTS